MGFHYNECGNATIMAQQIEDADGNRTFRKWNPEKKTVPYGQSTDAEQDSTYGNPICCYICLCVNCMMNTMFEEVVDHATDGKVPAEQYFKDQEDALGTAGSVIRPLGIFLCIFGHYLLFSPIIKILNMIPLVGWLLSGIVALAAIIFSVIVGLTLSVLTIAIAWLFFRPLFGICLLAIVGTSVYFTFYYDWGTAEVAGETTTPTETTPATPATPAAGGATTTG